MLRPFFVVACSALSLTLVAGCTQPIDDGHDRSDTSALRRLDPPAVHSGPRYNAYVQAVGCASINGTGGTWTASATFPGDRAFCAYHWSGAAVADTSTLFSTLLAAGVADDLIVRDIACELASQGRPSSSLWSGGGQEETTCGRPVVVDVWIDGDGGGGSMSCRSCVTASTDAAGYVDIVLPEALVTAEPSTLLGVIKGRRASYVQPGGVSAFRILLPSSRKPPSAVDRECPKTAVLAPAGSWVGATETDRCGRPPI
jgi:hypothetical protein